MKKIIVSAALTLSAFFLLASAPAKAQSSEFFFPSAYDRPAENVWGLNLGTTVGSSPGSPLASPFAPAAVAQTSARVVTPAVAAQPSPRRVASRRRQIAHVQ